MENPPPHPISVTVGICAYNEERNIGQLLKALQSQRTAVARTEQIVVVASGCTDRTPDVVSALAEEDSRIELVVQAVRAGKAAAINEALRRATGDVFILESADTVPGPETVELLTQPFQDPEVGVAAARPVPVNDARTLTVRMTHALWDLHHRVSLQVPKTGEMMAFRPVLPPLPQDVGNDEDWIRHALLRRGYRAVYDERAVVYNAAPATFAEFVKQRVRCNVQETLERRRHDIRVPTWDLTLVANAVFDRLRSARPGLSGLLAFGIVEAGVRIYSWVRTALRPAPLHVWERLETTKVVRVAPSRAEGSPAGTSVDEPQSRATSGGFGDHADDVEAEAEG